MRNLSHWIIAVLGAAIPLQTLAQAPYWQPPYGQNPYAQTPQVPMQLGATYGAPQYGSPQYVQTPAFGPSPQIPSTPQGQPNLPQTFGPPRTRAVPPPGHPLAVQYRAAAERAANKAAATPRQAQRPLGWPANATARRHGPAPGDYSAAPNNTVVDPPGSGAWNPFVAHAGNPAASQTHHSPSQPAAPYLPTPDPISTENADTGLSGDGHDSCAGTLDGCGVGCNPGCVKGRLFGLMPSDPCFTRFISPTSNPVYFEDPRTLTELRTIFVENRIPTPAGGGDYQAYLIQARAALSQRLSLVMTKSGWFNFNSPGLSDGDGFFDLNAGIKLNLIRGLDSRYLLSGGITYESPAGQSDVFQGQGDGAFYSYLTQGWEFMPCTHWLSAVGFRVPIERSAGSQLLHWSNHIDREFLPNVYGFFEVDWFIWTRSGQNFPGDLAGGDLIDLGASDVAGNQVVTATVGPTWKPWCNVELSGGFEYPLTDRQDLWHHRAYAHAIWRY